jgi:hypothetical protein
MRFTARQRLKTWAHASRVQSDEVTYGLGINSGGQRAGGEPRAGGPVAAVEPAQGERGLEMSKTETVDVQR